MNETEISSSCTVNTRHHPCQISPAVKFRLLVNMSRPYVYIQGRDMIKNKIVADQIINFCVMSSHAGAMDILTRLGIELIRKSINFDLRCPIKKVNKQNSANREVNSLSTVNFQGIYVIDEYRTSYGLLLNFYQTNQTQRYTITIKNRFKKLLQNVIVYQVDFEAVDV